ncbi:hypothetical protein [Amycolatopsis minnesotensis]|uniref:Uncharacterized protein n=1 Tax=Amycolatopsis minnesotensis TaxID=337894 RepID=A0ABP5DFV2_9PSEU
MAAFLVVPLFALAAILPVARWLAVSVPPRYEVPAGRTRVVLDEAFGYEHVEPLARRDLVALL